MVRVLSDYKEIDTRSSWQKVAAIITSVFVVLLVPTTVLGYYSESSIPGQPLYPLKRGIESMILAVESLTPYQKSLYYQTLAAKRVSEAQAVIGQAASSTDFYGNLSTSDQALSNIVITIKQAQQAASTLQNPVQKQEATQQLATAIQKYQTQLSSMDYSIKQHIISTEASPTSSISPTPPSTQTTNTTPTANPTTDTTTNTEITNTTAAATLQNQITQTQDTLQTISEQLQNTTEQQVEPTDTPTPTYFYQKSQGQDQRTREQDKHRQVN